MASALPAVAFLILAGSPTPASAADSSSPITVTVRSALEGQKGLGRIFSAAGSGDVARTADDVEDELQEERWLRLVSGDDAEVLVTITQRERVERSRKVDKDGKESINHRYSARGVVEVAGRRDTVSAEVDFTEGASYRNDDDQFEKVAEKLRDQINQVIFANLDALRPDRPQAGFDHKRKYKLLVKGDGLEVLAVEPGSPAEKAGLQLKDRIRRIDSEKGTDQMDYRARTWWTEGAGTRILLEVEREKQRQNVELTLLPRNDWASDGPSSRPFTPTSGASTSISLQPGMSELDVVKLMGQPREKVAFGAKSLWRYDAVSITFEKGRLVDMK
jgi:hypothetical protein